MRILAIDPGTTQSAWMLFDGAPVAFAIEPNEEVNRNVLRISAGRVTASTAKK